jgi:hypothetical protein
MEKVQFGGRRVAGFGVGEDLPTYVLGKQSIPDDAPVGSTVRESPGSPYETTCVKQADKSWKCSNGATFVAGELELRGALVCQAGEVVAGRWGLCVPTSGLALSTGNTLLQDGSVKAPDGTIVFDAITGKWSITTQQEIDDTIAAIKETITHPFDTGSKGAFAEGKGIGTIISNAGEGLVTGLVHPDSIGTDPSTDPKHKPDEGSPTWLYWAGAAMAIAAGGLIVVPIVREVIATRRVSRAIRRVEPESEPV